MGKQDLCSSNRCKAPSRWSCASLDQVADSCIATTAFVKLKVLLTSRLAEGAQTLQWLRVELSKASDAQFSGIFLDPTGQHVLTNFQISGVSEIHYLHAKWKKPRLLSKLKGTNVTAIAWNIQQVSEASTG